VPAASAAPVVFSISLRPNDSLRDMTPALDSWYIVVSVTLAQRIGYFTNE
jgi:hypothetical protein